MNEAPLITITNNDPHNRAVLHINFPGQPNARIVRPGESMTLEAVQLALHVGYWEPQVPAVDMHDKKPVTISFEEALAMDEVADAESESNGTDAA